LGISSEEEKKIWGHFKEKLLEWHEKKPKSFDKYQAKEYKDGDQLSVGGRIYHLEIDIDADRKTHGAKLNRNRVISMQLSGQDSPQHLQKSIASLLSRVVSQDYLPDITRRVNELNHQHFKKQVESISFKYNHSNWGSCSSKNNLNFSSRLLFAPDDVVDYVIIHELAHLVELNHSDRFWKLVSDAMPDYELKEKWLKVNGHICRF
jgi:predicted metal-dependent hydrolase